MTSNYIDNFGKKMEKIAFLINDTENTYHWGCYGTSHQIKKQLTQAGYTEILSLPVYTIPKLPNIPQRVEDFGDKTQFIERFRPIANAIMASDVVVVNGEGTIHDFNSGPRALLFLIYAAKHFFNKKVYLLNHSCYPNSGLDHVMDYYRAAYNACEFVAARESLSAHIIRVSLGVDCEQSFDSLPLSVRDIAENIPENIFSQPYVCLSGAVNYDFSRSQFVSEQIKERYPNHRQIYLVGAKAEAVRQHDLMVFEHLKQFLPDLELFDAKSFEDWLSVIKHAEILISGRYHYSIAAMCFTTPMIYFSSNTPKIEAIAWDLGLPKAVNSEDDFKRMLDNISNIPWVCRLEALCERAESNYSWLKGLH